MKRIIRQIMGWGMTLTLPLVMTSCGELFDMLDNPITPALQVLRAQLTLKVGESKPIQASTQAHVMLLYSSDNPAVATVDATGLITAVSTGSASSSASMPYAPEALGTGMEVSSSARTGTLTASSRSAR